MPPHVIGSSRHVSQVKILELKFQEVFKRLALPKQYKEHKGLGGIIIMRPGDDVAVGEDMAFTEAAEFARGITIEAAKEPAEARERESSSHMGVDDDVAQQQEQPKKAPKAEPSPAQLGGGWVAAGLEADVDADVDMADADEDDGGAAEAPENSVTRERAIGKGMFPRAQLSVHLDNISRGMLLFWTLLASIVLAQCSNWYFRFSGSTELFPGLGTSSRYTSMEGSKLLRPNHYWKGI